MRIVKELVILMITAAAVVYLFLPSLLPDLVPFVGWLDEGLATTILLSALKHWGFDLTGLFGKDTLADSSKAKLENAVIVDSESGGKTQKIRIPREVFERALREYQQQQYSQR